MNDLLHGKSHTPYSSSSLKIHSLLTIVNDIIINKRKNLLEFGAGISTLIMARAIHQYELDAKLYSVEDNAPWIQVVEDMLSKEGLNKYVTIIHAPLRKNTEISHCFSYSKENIEKALEGIKFDFMLIDGPAAYLKENENSRIASYDIAKNFLNENFSLFIDNADRVGEKQLIKKISNEQRIKIRKVNETFISAFSGPSFNISI